MSLEIIKYLCIWPIDSHQPCALWGPNYKSRKITNKRLKVLTIANLHLTNLLYWIYWIIFDTFLELSFIVLHNFRFKWYCYHCQLSVSVRITVTNWHIAGNVGLSQGITDQLGHWVPLHQCTLAHWSLPGTLQVRRGKLWLVLTIFQCSL